MVQRLLAAKSERESRLALFASWVVILFQFTLFLVIGVILFVYYRETGLAAPKPADRIYPAVHLESICRPESPGLVIAAILAAAMSNLSAALNSLASTTIMDFYRPLAPAVGGDSTDEARFPATRAAQHAGLGRRACSSSDGSRGTGARCSKRDFRSLPSYMAHCSACSCSACSRGASARIGAMAGMVASMTRDVFRKNINRRSPGPGTS